MSGKENSEDEAEAVDLRNLDPEGWQRDRVLYNATLFMINASWYYELHAATEDSNTGRIFEVLKVGLHFWLLISCQNIDLGFSSFYAFSFGDPAHTTTGTNSYTSPAAFSMNSRTS